MENFKSKIVCIALLTSLCWFSAFTDPAFAIGIQDISPEQKAEYLALPEQDSKILMMLLIQDFTNEKINLEASACSTANERAVPSILRSAIRMDILNHLLIHAPIEALGQIIKASIKITQSFVIQDVSDLISKIEKFTAQKAVEAGMDFLLQNEIKISPGAMEFEYISQNNQKKSVIFQYIIVFQKIDAKFNRIFIKIYSPDYIEPPKRIGSVGSTRGVHHDLTNDLPPFVVEVDGVVEKNTASSYKWTQEPKISIEFPDKVEDFGIKPLGFWEKRVFKPIEDRVNDVKVVLTKLFGKEIASSLRPVGLAPRNDSARESAFARARDAYENANMVVDNLLTNMWTRLGEVISDVNPFGAGIGMRLRGDSSLRPVAPSLRSGLRLTVQNDNDLNRDPSSGDFGSDKLSVENKDGILRGVYAERQRSVQNDDVSEDEPAQIFASQKNVAGKVSQEFLRGAVEQLDDIAEMIDVLSVRVEQVKNSRDSLACAGAEMGGGPGSFSFEITELAMMEEGDGAGKQGDRTDKDKARDEADADADADADLPMRDLTEQGDEADDLEIVICDKQAMGVPARDKVIFNEICWMGNSESASNEWIELKNISGQEIVLSGWQIIDKKNQIEIVLPLKLGGDPSSDHFYWLGERGDDDSVKEVEADFIYKGALNNSNEELYLFDENCVLQDKVFAAPDWRAGDNAAKRTMERPQTTWGLGQGVAGFEWQTSARVGGTPGADNSSGYIAPVYASGGGGGSSGGSGSSSAPAQPQIQSLKILINEIQIEGETSKDEFIELYNPNDVSVNLSEWSLKKKTSSGAETNLVSSNYFSGVIPANGYFLIVPQLDDQGNPQYQGAAIFDLCYSGKNYSITPDNTILLYDKNDVLIDKLGFGNALDFETAPFPENPETKDLISDWLEEIAEFEGTRTCPLFVSYQSLGRKINEQGDYFDTDNNAEDFEIQDPTPKNRNQIFFIVWIWRNYLIYA